MNMKLYILTAACLVVLIFFSITGTFHSPIVAAREQRNDRSQTIKFSHAYHTKDVGAGCEDCHSSARKSKGARDNLLPLMADCYKCHDEKTTECTFCHKGPEPYPPFDNPERSIMYSHEYHLETLGLKCENCHTGLDTLEYSTPSTLPTMALCYMCHNDDGRAEGAHEPAAQDSIPKEFVVRRALNICDVCHLSTVGLLPANHRVSDFKKEHKQFARLGGNNGDCQMCHRIDTFCQDCHTNAAIGKTETKSSDVYTSFGIRSGGANPNTPMTLELVHSLNYRFTHGIDAKGKSSDCSSCHDTRTFCVQCHTQDGAITLRNQPAPAWHSSGGFTTGRIPGSGGGRHAEFARRDIESCQACHDTQGSDPICITCHNDPDGMKGTDPSTHERGYSSSEHGSWHNDPGATCNTCHTDPNAHPGGMKGRYFCGYCHS